MLQNVTLALNSLITSVQTYPVAWASLVRSIILCATAFGFHLTADQIASLMLVVESVLAVLTHQAVTPNNRVSSVLVENQNEVTGS